MKYLSLLMALLGLAFTTALTAQPVTQSEVSRIEELEKRLSRVEHRSRSSEAAGVAVFVAGSLCALWAQQTGRNAWLWFFLGMFFNVITLLVLLYKNSDDRQRIGKVARTDPA